MLQMMTKHYFFLHYIFKVLFYKFYLIQKKVSFIFAFKLMNFTDFHDKLFKNLYGCNFTLNLVKNNDVKLPWKYGDLKNLRVPNFMQIYLFLLYIASTYWIRCFEFLS